MLPKCRGKRTLCLVVGKAVSAATVENSVEFPQKTKRRTTYHMTQQFPPGYVSKEESRTSQMYLHSCVLQRCSQ